MRLRTPLLLLAGAVAGAVVPSSAFAAVPKSSADYTVPCESSAKSARVWVSKNRWAAENPCDRWLVIAMSNEGAGGSSATGVFVAPGAHFHRRSAISVADYYNVYFKGTATKAPSNCWPEGLQPVVFPKSGGQFKVVPISEIAAENCS